MGDLRDEAGVVLGQGDYQQGYLIEPRKDASVQPCEILRENVRTLQNRAAACQGRTGALGIEIHQGCYMMASDDVRKAAELAQKTIEACHVVMDQLDAILESGVTRER